MFTTVAAANTAIGRHPASRSPLGENSKPIDTNAGVLTGDGPPRGDMRATYAQPFPRSPVAISANRNSDDEAGLLDRRKFACRSEHRAAVDLTLLDASEQHTDVVAGPRLVDRLTEDLDAVDTRIEGAVDLHGVADP